MKLKEAQMLGILALIAVGIIMLCMWGGGYDLEEGSATGQETASADDLAAGLLERFGLRHRNRDRLRISQRTIVHFKVDPRIVPGLREGWSPPKFSGCRVKGSPLG